MYCNRVTRNHTEIHDNMTDNSSQDEIDVEELKKIIEKKSDHPERDLTCLKMGQITTLRCNELLGLVSEVDE